MHRRTRTWLPVVLIGLGVVVAVGQSTTIQAAEPPTSDPTAEDPPPAAADPTAVTDLASAIRQTVAVVEGVVGDIENEYTDADGPWTRVVLTDVTTHFGRTFKQVDVRQFG